MKKSGLADSPFFLAPTQEVAVHPPMEVKNQPIVNEQPNERTSVRTEERSENRTVIFPNVRRSRRYSFEFYDDQLRKIKELKYLAEQAGQRVTLSDIVRQALDEYLKTK